MTFHATAIYEKGVLRLLTPSKLVEGEQVEVIILPKIPAGASRPPAAILAEIAALPVEGSGGSFTSRDHDRALYDDAQS
jgi:predicted DNA-binding antitoxin AbrB/MazE fold protein